MAEQIIKKQCTKCKQTSPVSEFYKVPKNKSGLHSWCKTCVKDAVAEYQREKGYEICKSARKRYKQTKKGRYACRKSAASNSKRNAQKRREYAKHYRSLNRDKARAKEAIRNEIKRGRKKKAREYFCNCGRRAAHYHHYLGYAREHWLDVLPLCCSCHKKVG